MHEICPKELFWPPPTPINLVYDKYLRQINNIYFALVQELVPSLS